MKKKVLFIFRHGALNDILSADGKVDGPNEFMWGMGDLDREQFDVRFVNAPRTEKRVGIRRLTWFLEFPFSKLVKIGLPIEIYPLFKKEIAWADEIVCVNDQITIGVLFWRLFGKMKKQRVHCIVMSLQERIKYFRRNKLIVWFIGALLRRADSLLTLSDFVHDDFISDYKLDKKKVKTYYFGIDTGFWKPVETSEENFVLAIGNDLNRDYATLVEALPDNVALKIITKKKVDTKEKNIELLSFWLTDEEVREMYSKAKLVVVPSEKLKNESSGLSCALQTLACGRPLLMSDPPPIKEVLEDKKDCVFFEAENATDLRQKMQALLADDQRRNLLAAQGHTTVTEKYTAKRMSQRLGEILSA